MPCFPQLSTLVQLLSARVGVKNLQRVAKMLMPATAWKEGETYEELNEIYGRMVSQWSTEMAHVAQIVGGFNSQEAGGGEVSSR